MKSIPYVYIIKNKTTGLKYVGAKYAYNSDPRLFWVTYFTSSKKVKELIDIFGKDDFTFRIIKTFTSKYDALKFENNLNRLAFYRKDYLNIHYNFIGRKTEDQYNYEVEKNKKAVSIVGMMTYIKKIGFHKLSEKEKLEVCSLGGYAAAKVNKLLNRAIFDPEVRKRQHETLRREQKSAYYDPSLRHEISSKGGKVGTFSKYYYEKNNIPEEDRIRAQSERGKKGGAANKGFKWYNDGVKSYKYTKKQQEILSFEEFIKNKKIKKGRAEKQRRSQ